MARAFSSSATTVRLEGAEGLRALLDSLPKKIANKILREALKKAAEPIRSAAEAKAPVDTGELKRSVAIRKGKRKVKGGQSIVIFPDPKKFKDDFHAPYVEYGTAEMHAEPFMRPAYDQTKDQALAIVTDEITRAVAAAHAPGKK